jgi:hypothetical protein
MHRPYLLYLMVVLGAAPAAPAQHASDSPSPATLPTTFWFSGGLGVGAAGAGPHTEAGGGVAGRLAFNVHHGRMVATVRAAMSTGGASEYSALFIDVIRDQAHDVGILAGYAFPVGQRWDILASAGVAGVWVSRAVPADCAYGWCLFGDGRREHLAPVVGIPLELGVLARISERIGVGATAFGNVNAEESFGGLSLNVSWGFVY